MKMNVIGKNVTVTEGMREKICDKLGDLHKYGNLNEDTLCKVLVRTVKADQIIEVTIFLDSKKMIRVEKRDRDFYKAVDMAEETLKRKLRKNKEKKNDKHRLAAGESLAEAEAEAVEDLICKEKQVNLRRETVKEALEAMDELDHDFHLFVNDETDEINVIYRRTDGGYGIIYTCMPEMLE